MTRNFYDNDDLFVAHDSLPRATCGSKSAPEWSIARNMVLGDDARWLEGKRVLDLACGYGWFSRWVANESGAAHVRAMDLSHKMIDKAREFGNDAKIDYEVGDLETFSTNEQYDLVHCSLAIHYISDLDRLFHQVHTALAPGGKFVFSVEHPVRTAPTDPERDWKVVKDDNGQERTVWPLDGYFDEGVRMTTWLGVPGIKKYHYKTDTYVNTLIQNGFTLTGMKDWTYSNPIEHQRPFLLLFSAQKL